MKKVCIVRIISSVSEFEEDISLIKKGKFEDSLELIVLNTGGCELPSFLDTDLGLDILCLSVGGNSINSIIALILKNTVANHFCFTENSDSLNLKLVSKLGYSKIQLHIFGGKNSAFISRKFDNCDVDFFSIHLLNFNNVLLSRQLLETIKICDVNLNDIGRSAYLMCESIHLSTEEINSSKNGPRERITSLIDGFKYYKYIGKNDYCLKILEHVYDSSWFLREIGKIDAGLVTIFVDFFSDHIDTYLIENHESHVLQIFQQQWLSSINNKNIDYALGILNRIDNNNIFCLPLRNEDFSGTGGTLSAPDFHYVDENTDLSSKFLKSNDMSLDYSLVGRGEFGRHRDGWNFVIQNLLRNIEHQQDALGFDCFMEKTFVWNYGQEASGRQKAWFGITHRPTQIPDFYDWKSKVHFYQSPFFNVYAETLCGLITVSSDHADYLRTLFDIPIKSLLHPTNHNVKSWNQDCLNNEEIRIVQVGSWLRKMHSIFRLPRGKYRKSILASRDQLFNNVRFIGERGELVKGRMYNERDYDSVDFIGFLDDKEYDYLLANSIVFLDMFSSTANNTVLECIARKTPIVVRKLPSTVEYLGKDYPLFFDDLKQASELASDKNLLLKAHEYLYHRSKLRDFHINGFVDNFKNAICNFV